MKGELFIGVCSLMLLKYLRSEWLCDEIESFKSVWMDVGMEDESVACVTGQVVSTYEITCGG